MSPEARSRLCQPLPRPHLNPPLRAIAPMNFLRLPLLRQATAAILVAGLLLQSATAVAPGPAWWDSQTVLDPYALADDFAAANTGQLKYMATKKKMPGI